MDGRGLAQEHESVKMARAELVDALTGPGVPQGRAEHLVDRLMWAVRVLVEAETADATVADLEAVAPRLGMDPDELVGMVHGRAGTTHHVVRPDHSAN